MHFTNLCLSLLCLKNPECTITWVLVESMYMHTHTIMHAVVYIHYYIPCPLERATYAKLQNEVIGINLNALTCFGCTQRDLCVGGMTCNIDIG